MTGQVKIAYYKGTRKENPKATWLDRIICAVTGSRFSHVEVVTGYNRDSYSECWSASIRDKGVRRAMINLESGHWEVWSTGTVSIDRAAIIEFFQRHEGKRYDLLGALGLKLPFVKNYKNRWFCSEIVSEIYAIGEPGKTSPGDVFDYFAKHGHRPAIARQTAAR